MAFSLGSIFGSSSSVPRYNTAPLKDILNTGAAKQRTLANDLPGQLAPVDQQFSSTQGQLGTDFTKGTKDLGADYLNSLNNPQIRDEAVGRINENAFRNVPAAQQAIKESLAGTGRLGNGRAQNLLAQPVLQAAQQSGDQATEYDVNQNNIRQGALGTTFNANQNALASKLGLDSDTARTLMQNGRGDLIQKAANLMGIEGDATQGLFNLENTSQQSNIASAQADNQQRQALINSLLGIGGQVAGAYIGRKPISVAAPRG